jgi:hypothetical protein
MTDQKAAEGPQERPEGGSAGLRPPEPLVGAQAGADDVSSPEELVEHYRDTIGLLRERLNDEVGAKRVAAGAADRFRDVLCEVLGHHEENPGDDVLVAELRSVFGKTGPEPMAWRNRLAGYEAIRDQINAAAAHNAGPTVAECAEADRAYWTDKHAGDQP